MAKAFLHLFIATLAVATVFGAPSIPNTIPEEVSNISHQEAESLLRKFMTESDDNGTLVANSIQLMLRTYQRYYGLPEAGLLSNETKLTLRAPKCGRIKRSSPYMGIKWRKSSLTYRISIFPSGKSPTAVRKVMKNAFSSWSAVTMLNFREVRSRPADIDIKFVGKTHRGKNGESCLFRNEYAHAFPPEDGSIHINTRLYFRDPRYQLSALMLTAVHEIGHSLRLAHINNVRSVMHPNGGLPKPQPIDIKNIRRLYGVRNKRSVTVVPKLYTLPKIDAALQDDLGNTFIFAGDYYFDALSPNTTGQLISTKWPGMPGPVEAAFWYAGRAYFFKEDLFWVFNGSNLVPGRPRTISSGFPGLPNGIEAALVVGTDYIFAFKGDHYWLYLVREKRVTNKGQMADIGLLTSDFDAALETTNGVKIFKGRDFYIWNREETTQSIPECWIQC